MITDARDDVEIRHGSRIGRFVVVGELGAGGMGVVYAAHDPELDRKVALKVLRGSAASDEERMRMLREGQAMARVTHPNVITVYEVGTEGALVFLAQELLDAGTLGQWLETPRASGDIIERFVAAGRGLAAAHAAGLVHRDFKPDNVLLGNDGRVRVADFGLARALGPSGEELAATVQSGGADIDERLARSPMSQLTRTGAVMGTPMFMAPEQHNGARADERSDQFSFCVALYHALHGDWPFAGKTAVALAESVIRGRIQPPPKRSRVPARLRRILVRGLATDPAGRYPSIEALLADLTHDPGRRVRRYALVTGLVVLVGGAVVGGWALRSTSSAQERYSEPAPPPVPLDVKDLTNARSIEWLSSAMERGQLDDATEKYEMAGALKLQAGEKTQASIAYSAGVFTLVLRGLLDKAEARLRDADATKAQDPIALAFADMATASIALARGDLPGALARSRQCATSFTSTLPALAAMCLEMQGETAVAMGEVAVAHKAFADGRAIASKEDGPQRGTTLGLALAELDLDEGRDERAAASATAVQAAAAERGAVSLEVQARVVLARTLVAQGASQKALDVLEPVKPETVQPFRIRIEHAIRFGQATALAGDPVEGLGRIDAARAEAEKQGFTGLVFEARLARVEVLFAMAGADAQPQQSKLAAQAEQSKLVTDARARGYGRIARIAETIEQP